MNHLKGAVSKYLLQHANNPVDWYPWGEEPFEKAHQENKPVIVSIGYSACHWCHVMAHESFEDPEVAAFMNEHFVCIKVDREENPDVDQFYMDALQSLTGSGGWPLNMFVTPEKKPFYGGTYFPPEGTEGRSSWMDLLRAVAKVWVENPMGIADQAEEMMNHLKRAAFVGTHQNNIPDVDQEFMDTVIENLLQSADTAWGGFGEAPKFPGSFSIRLLLDYYDFQIRWDRKPDLRERALKQATLTLDKMISGGIYDQVGGGFFRYSIDAQWQVPHYEKMLYDNALMISALCVAYKITRKEEYRMAIEETIDFCNRELKASDVPGFYCSLDADTNGVEGGYYLWNLSKWSEALPHAHPAVNAYFDMENRGQDWDDHGLVLGLDKSEVLSKFKLSGSKWSQLLKKAKENLLAFRERGKHPGIDDKLLLSWNALMNRALQEAGVVLGRLDLLEQAETHLNWMFETFCKEDEAHHVFKGGKGFVSAKLDDWAFLIDVMIRLSETLGKKEWLCRAKSCMDLVLKHFNFEGRPYFYFSDDRQRDVPVRKVELYDGSEPSGNSVLAEALFVLGACFGLSEWEERGRKMLEGMAITVRDYGRSFSYWGILLQYYQAKIKTLVISGKDAGFLHRKWLKGYYFPDVHAYFIDGVEGEIPLFVNKYVSTGENYYLCFGNQCLTPFHDEEKVRLEIKKNQ